MWILNVIRNIKYYVYGLTFYTHRHTHYMDTHTSASKCQRGWAFEYNI